MVCHVNNIISHKILHVMLNVHPSIEIFSHPIYFLVILFLLIIFRHYFFKTLILTSTSILQAHHQNDDGLV